MDTDARKAALQFLSTHKTGVLSTLSPQGTPRSRTIYYACDDAFRIYFLTLENTRKAEDIKVHHEVAFAVSDEATPKTVQIEGIAGDISEKVIDDPVLGTLFKNITSNAEYFAPITRLDTDRLIYFEIMPSWVRFGDFTEGRHTDVVTKEIVP